MPIEIWNLASLPLPEDAEAPSCEVFRATVRRADGTKAKAHLKVLEQQPLAVELLVNALARSLDLPVPDCFLVRVKKPQISAFARSMCFRAMEIEEDFAVFGSATIEHPTLDHFLDRDVAGRRLLDFIREMADLELAAIFDEWIANDDRHERNILIANANTWWLIDHNLAFNQGIWHAGALAPERRYGNYLGDLLLAPPVEVRSLRVWRDGAQQMSQKGQLCNAPSSVQEANCYGFLSPSQAQMLGDFLEERIEHLPELIRQRLAHATTRSATFPAPVNPSSPTQQMSLPWEPPFSP